MVCLFFWFWAGMLLFVLTQVRLTSIFNDVEGHVRISENAELSFL